MEQLTVNVISEQYQTPGCSNQIKEKQSSPVSRRPVSRLSCSPRSHVYFNRTGCKFDNILLNNLLKTERQQYRQTTDYFVELQTHLKPSMRRICVQWMAEVCSTEYSNEQSVFNLSVSLLDRFLSIEQVFKTQLQTLASACLLVASKVVMPVPFNITKLSAYTEYSVTTSELMSWEMLVLSRLNWDVSAVTSIDFVQPLLTVLHLPPVLSNKLRPVAYGLCQAFVLEHDMSLLPQSMQAGVALCLATQQVFGSDAELMAGLAQAVVMAIDCDAEWLNSVIDNALLMFSDPEEDQDQVQEQGLLDEDEVEQAFPLQPITPLDTKHLIEFADHDSDNSLLSVDEGVCMDETDLSSDDSMLIA